jgi:hypothetical protein
MRNGKCGLRKGKSSVLHWGVLNLLFRCGATQKNEAQSQINAPRATTGFSVIKAQAGN